MALKDIWVDKIDGVDDVYAEDINEIAKTVMDLEENPTSGGTNLTEEQLSNINAVPNKVDKEDGYGLCNIKRLSVVDWGDVVTHDTVMQDGTVSCMTLYTREGVSNLLMAKSDKTKISTSTDIIPTFEFASHNNKELHLSGNTHDIFFNFDNGEYSEDYTAGLSFNSGESPTCIHYTGTGILNWVGTDCSTDSYVDDEGITHQVSIFQPSAKTHYDIVFYYNGTQFIGLVNGYVPASGNVVSV